MPLTPWTNWGQRSAIILLLSKHSTDNGPLLQICCVSHHLHAPSLPPYLLPPSIHTSFCSPLSVFHCHCLPLSDPVSYLASCPSVHHCLLLSLIVSICLSQSVCHHHQTINKETKAHNFRQCLTVRGRRRRNSPVVRVPILCECG